MIRQSAVVATGTVAFLAFGGLAGPAAVAAPVLPSYWGVGTSATALVDAATAAEITGARKMAVVAAGAQPTDSSSRVKPARCISVYGPVEKVSYEDADWLSVSEQLLADGEPGEASAIVDQAVVTFASADAAADYVDGVLDDWRRCSETQLLVLSRDGAVKEQPIGQAGLNARGTILTIPVGSATNGCERAIARHDTDVFDVQVCQFAGDAKGQAEAVVEAMNINKRTGA